MKIISLLIATMSFVTFAASPLTSGQAYQLNRSSKLAADIQLGVNLRDAQQFGTKAQWSYAVSGGAANSDISLLDSEGRPVKLPAGAVITNCLIDVVTQPTSATSSGKLAFSSKAVADLKASSFVAAYTTTLPLACIPTGTQATMIKLSSEGTLKVRTGSEALTGGKINIWVQYVLAE